MGLRKNNENKCFILWHWLVMIHWNADFKFKLVLELQIEYKTHWMRKGNTRKILKVQNPSNLASEMCQI